MPVALMADAAVNSYHGGSPALPPEKHLTLSPARRLLAVKITHTLVWAFFAGCVLAIPMLAWQGRVVGATLLCGVVLIEVAILLANGMHCPLTPIAARYTEDRRANFDIFLPEWLARNNKEVFGGLYALGLAYVAYLWLR